MKRFEMSLKDNAASERETSIRFKDGNLDLKKRYEHIVSMCQTMKSMKGALALIIGLLIVSNLQAQVPTTLTDKIFKGGGTINLLKDISGADLQQYINANGSLLLGVDLNEDAAGNESRDSVGVAIKQLELVVTTTAGTVSFTDFVTSTTASIKEAGASTPQDYYTLFGRIGSSQITGGSSELNKLDDVVKLQNVSIQGTILSAQLRVKFLDTASTNVQGNETFFDWSDGFEDFALLGSKDAALLEAANYGLASAPSGVTYTATGSVVTPPTPGAPVPPLGLLMAMGLVVAWKSKRSIINVKD